MKRLSFKVLGLACLFLISGFIHSMEMYEGMASKKEEEVTTGANVFVRSITNNTATVIKVKPVTDTLISKEENIKIVTIQAGQSKNLNWKFFIPESTANIKQEMLKDIGKPYKIQSHLFSIRKASGMELIKADFQRIIYNDVQGKLFIATLFLLMPNQKIKSERAEIVLSDTSKEVNDTYKIDLTINEPLENSEIKINGSF